MALTLAGVQIVAVVAWTVFYLFEVGHQRGLTPFDYGEPLYWLLPAVFLLLGSVGLVMVASTPRGLRREPWAIGLFMASLFAFTPLGWYAFLEGTLRTFGPFP